MTRQRLSIPVGRRLILDGLQIAPRHVYFPVERVLQLGAVNAARSALTERISWSVLWLKAYALVCARIPQLRQSYQRWFWPHLLQLDDVVGMLIVNRQQGDHERLCWARFVAPHERTLPDLQQELHHYQHDPIEQAYRKQVQFAKFPWPLRRLLWFWQINFSGRRRAMRLGTFTQSTLAGQGANNGFHQTLLTSSLCFGPLNDQGQLTATIIADHRVLDGAVVARALEQLQQIFNQEILTELLSLNK